MRTTTSMTRLDHGFHLEFDSRTKRTLLWLQIRPHSMFDALPITEANTWLKSLDRTGWTRRDALNAARLLERYTLAELEAMPCTTPH